MKKGTKTDFFTNIKVTYNPELDKYADVIMCPEKQKLAEEEIDRCGGPAEFIKMLDKIANGSGPQKIKSKK